MKNRTWLVGASLIVTVSMYAAQAGSVAQPAATLVSYTGANLIRSGEQTVTAKLTDSHGRTPIAARPVSFSLSGATATAVTDPSGVATATLKVPAGLAGDAAQLQVSFPGDDYFQPSKSAAPVKFFQPTSFVIWGGNHGGLAVGQRVSFWGAQWANQVTDGEFQANASFKGFAISVEASPALPCQPQATATSLIPGCWETRPGNTFPPAKLPGAIEAIVTTAVVKSGRTIYGNIACTAVLSIDEGAAFNPDPEKTVFGTILALNGDCSNSAAQPHGNSGGALSASN